MRAVFVILLLSACATAKPYSFCSQPITGNSCEEKVEAEYCGKLKELAPEVQEIVLKDMECSHHEGDQETLAKLGCYGDDSKANAAMKKYWNLPEGQALIYFPDKYEKAKAKCKNPD